MKDCLEQDGSGSHIGRRQDMTRRQESSPAEDLMALVAMLSGWAGVVLAVVFYLVLHRVAVTLWSRLAVAVQMAAWTLS